MNYTEMLEKLRKQIAETDISEEVKTKVEPIRPQTRGFAPRVASSRSQPEQQAPQYDPQMIVTTTMQKMQEARANFEKKMQEVQKNTQEQKTEQMRPRVRPFNLTGEEETSGGFMQRPMSRRDAILNRTNFEEGNRPRGPAGSGTPTTEEEAVAQAIKDIESSGGDYSARGPVVQTGMYAGQRAMGAYQVMPGNLPSWSREALGREVSEEEFMSDRDIQDAIFFHQMRKARERYGTWEDAASVWFTGQPVSRSGNRSDGYMAAPEYIQRFSSALNRYMSEVS